jgi:hypothetical protein
MTKRLILAASALCLSIGCGDDGRTVGPESERDAGTGTTPRRDASTRDARVTTDDDDPSPVGNTNTGDRDGDGFTGTGGDCDDSNDKVNPGAYDFPGDAVDDDCSGDAAKTNEGCDTGLALDSSDPKDAARAIGLCKFTDEGSKDWGVVSARFTDASGTGKLASPQGVGLLPSLGAAKPRAGAALLALSSGVARAPDQAGYTSTCDTLDECVFLCLGGEPPAGYPKESSACGATAGSPLGAIFGSGTNLIYDQVALEVKVRVPNNVSSLGFESIFYTTEYPSYVCSPYNDFFVVFKDPKPANVADGNIVFDSNGDTIGVNTGLLAVCDPAVQDANALKKFDCPQGTGLLQGTGFAAGEADCPQAGGAATGWLRTTAPVEKNQIITLRFAIWDTNDNNLDSTVLIDKFEWSSEEGQVATEPVIGI